MPVRKTTAEGPAARLPAYVPARNVWSISGDAASSTSRTFFDDACGANGFCKSEMSAGIIRFITSAAVEDRAVQGPRFHQGVRVPHVRVDFSQFSAAFVRHEHESPGAYLCVRRMEALLAATAAMTPFDTTSSPIA